MNAPRYVVGVDVGGTFTDVFALDQTTGEATIAKTPSTLDDQSRGFAAGIESLVPDLSQVATVEHGTTTGTNALLERKGARAGLITSEGFRDVLEMRRRDRPTTWGLWGQFQPASYSSTPRSSFTSSGVRSCASASKTALTTLIGFVEP